MSLSWSDEVKALGFSAVEVYGSVDIYRSCDGVLVCTLSISQYLGYAQVTFFVDLDQIDIDLGRLILEKLKIMEVCFV